MSSDEFVMLGRTPSPKGINNPGSLCYLNSAIQAIMSCTSISNKIEKEYNSDISRRYFPHLKGLSMGQDSARLALIALIEYLAIKRHVGHRYRCYIKCPSCNYTCSEDQSVDYIHNMWIDHNIELYTDQLDGYKCKCQKLVRTRLYKLTMVSEVFIISYNVYLHKYPKNIAMTLKIASFRYKLVAIIVHYGNIGGGHYIAIVLRNDKWYMANDSSIMQVDNIQQYFANTYIALYHMYQH